MTSMFPRLNRKVMMFKSYRDCKNSDEFYNQKFEAYYQLLMSAASFLIGYSLIGLING